MLSTYCALFMLFVSLTTSDHLEENQCLEGLQTCGECGDPIKVTIIARNQLVDPKFEVSVTLEDQPQRELLHFLEQAAEENSAFKFEATYYATLGYFIDTINGVRGFNSNKTFWHIISVDGVGSLECGASTFVPKHEETILFNFTTWAEAGFDYDN